ncbi:MAG: DUF4340 domain-containing protein [Terriglobia bacterium]
MSKRYLKSLIAIIVLLVLWFSFTRWNKHKGREEAQKARQTSAQKLLAAASNQIDSFTLTTRDGATFTCAKQGNTWSITQPQPISADQSKINSFLQSLTSATEDQQIASNPSSLKDYGLDPPAETLAVTTATIPRRFTLRLGDETPTSSGVYAQVAGRPDIFTVTDDVKTALEKKLFDLRDTRAVTLSSDQISRIQVKNGNQSYTLAKNPDGVWDVSLPVSVRADHFTVEGLTDSLQSLTMQSIVSETKKDDPKYGFSKPTLTADLITPSGSQTLVIGKKADQGYYAMNSALAPVFTLDESSVSQFQKSASDFRDKNLFSWDMFDVKSFEVTTPKGHWAFEQNKNQWKQTAPASKSMPSDDVNAFLSALRSLQAASFPAAQPGQAGQAGQPGQTGQTGKMNQFGFNQPSYTFKVTFGAKNQTEVVDVAEANGKDYARRDSDALPSEVSQSTLAAIENTFQKISK